MTTAVVVLCSAFLTGAGAAAATGAPAARGAALTGTWGTAQEVPGTGALNVAGRAGITSVSCNSAGNCGAAGFYASGTLNSVRIQQAMVVSEINGIWGKAAEVPGTAALNAGGNAGISELACTSAGNCSAGGHYTDAAGIQQAFVVSETNGTWGTAVEVPGFAALNVGTPGGTVNSLSCGAAGNCSAGGYYSDAAGHWQAFVVSETNGTWGTAKEVPGSGGLNAGGHAMINSVACAAAGTCSAGGSYASSSVDGVPTVQAFVLTETNGTWGAAKEVPGTASLNAGKYAEVNSVSCASAGNCSAGGEYTNGTPATEAFTVNQVNGTWRTAKGSPRHRGPERRRARPDHLVVMHLGGQLQRRRVLRGCLLQQPGLRAQPDQRHLGHGPGGPRLPGPRHGQPWRRAHLGVLWRPG
jgi:hypothetical protein